MKNIFGLWICLVSFVVIGIGCSQAPVPESQLPRLRKEIKDVNYRTGQEVNLKKRVVVLPFTDKMKADNGYQTPESVRENSRKAFVIDINRSDKILVADESDFKLNLKKYLKNDEYDLKKMAQDSHSLGVSSIIEGQVIDVRLKKQADQIGFIRNLTAVYEVVVRMRMYNVRSEQEIFHTVKTVTLEEENTRIAERVSGDMLFVKNPGLVEVLIKDAFLDFSPQIMQALDTVTWEGRIAAMRADKVYLNVGRISGVQVGDLLKVVDEGSEVYDPEIGYHLGKIPGRVKGTLEIISYFGNDGAVALVHSGAGFKEGDRVELYQ